MTTAARLMEALSPALDAAMAERQRLREAREYRYADTIRDVMQSVRVSFYRVKVSDENGWFWEADSD